MANLERVGIRDKAAQRADTLSGGQQQRVGIARALMQEPRLMLADEPVASLDPATSHSVMRYLEQINKEDGITVLCNLHFLSLARRYAHRVLALRGGELVADLDPNAIDEAKFRLEATAFATGTGSTQPYGVVTRGASDTTTGALSAAQVYGLLQNLPPRFRVYESARPAWLANVAIIEREGLVERAAVRICVRLRSRRDA